MTTANLVDYSEQNGMTSKFKYKIALKDFVPPPRDTTMSSYVEFTVASGRVTFHFHVAAKKLSTHLCQFEIRLECLHISAVEIVFRDASYVLLQEKDNVIVQQALFHNTKLGFKNNITFSNGTSFDKFNLILNTRAPEIDNKFQYHMFVIYGTVEYPDVGEREFSCHVSHLLVSKEYSDVDIIVGSKMYQAHKIILARSPVFAAMFQRDMQERQENVVRISDISPGVFEHVLLYIYTSACPKIRVQACQLLYAAEKYNLEGLKYICEKEMYRKLTANNACKYLIQADMYNAGGLQKDIINYIKSHLQPVLQSSGWKGIESYPRLITAILQSMV